MASCNIYAGQDHKLTTLSSQYSVWQKCPTINAYNAIALLKKKLSQTLEHINGKINMLGIEPKLSENSGGCSSY